MSRFCHGMKYKSKGIAMKLKYKHKINQCFIGAFGILVDDVTDCQWYTYIP